MKSMKNTISMINMRRIKIIIKIGKKEDTEINIIEKIKEVVVTIKKKIVIKRIKININTIIIIEKKIILKLKEVFIAVKAKKIKKRKVKIEKIAKEKRIKTEKEKEVVQEDQISRIKRNRKKINILPEATHYLRKIIRNMNIQII